MAHSAVVTKTKRRQHNLTPAYRWLSVDVAGVLFIVTMTKRERNRLEANVLS